MNTNDSDPFDYLDRTDLETPHANQPEDTLEHVRVRNDHMPDELILIPADATEAELQTAWLAATDEQSFVALDDAR